MDIFGVPYSPKIGGRGRVTFLLFFTLLLESPRKLSLRCLQTRPETTPASPVTTAVTSTLRRSYHELWAGLGCSVLQLVHRSSVAEAEMIGSKYLTNTPRKGEWKATLTLEDHAFL